MPERNASQQRPACSVLNSLSLSLSTNFSSYRMYIYIYMYNSNNSHPLAHVSMLYIVLIYASCCCAGSIQHYHQTAAEGGIQNFVSLGMGWVKPFKTYYTIWVCISVYQLFWCSPKKVQRFDPQPFVDERACQKDFWNPQSETLLDMTCCNLYKIMQTNSSCL